MIQNFCSHFSQVKSLQQSALKAFASNTNDKNKIQDVFNHRAKMNSLSSKGEWKENLENKVV